MSKLKFKFNEVSSGYKNNVITRPKINGCFHCKCNANGKFQCKKTIFYCFSTQRTTENVRLENMLLARVVENSTFLPIGSSTTSMLNGNFRCSWLQVVNGPDWVELWLIW